MAEAIDVTVYNDPGCPWGYSVHPAIRTLDWRYGDQLRWRLVLIGLTERAQQYADRGYHPLTSAQGQLKYRRYGMPIAPHVKAGLSATSPACRVVVAARIDTPGSEWEVHRALQFAQFTTDLVLEDRAGLRRALDAAGHDGAALVGRIEDEDVLAAYEADRAEARTAAGGAGSMQGKTANTDGAERYTAPSIVFERGDQRLEATGFQPLAAYDVLLANLDPTLERRAAAEHARDVVAHFPGGVVRREVATIRASGNDPVDDAEAERELLEAQHEGSVRRVPLGDQALWLPAG